MRLSVLLMISLSASSVPLFRAGPFEPNEKQIKEFASIYYGDSDVGSLLGSYSAQIETPSGYRDGKIYMFSSGKGYVVEGSNCYGSVSLINPYIPQNSLLTFNAYSNALVMDGHLAEQRTNETLLTPKGPKGDPIRKGSASDERPLSMYIKDKYGENCKLDCHSLLGHVGVDQYSLSNYLKRNNETETFSSEPNCALTACYNVFSCLNENKPEIFPDSMNVVSPYNPKTEEPDMYSYFMDKNNSGERYAFRDGVRRYYDGYSLYDPIEDRTDLYRKIRQASFQTKPDWYSSSGLDIWQSSQMAERVAGSYGIDGFDSWEKIDYNAYVGTQEFKDNFDVRSTPLIFATSAGVYGSHEIAVFGYWFYKLEKKVLFFTVTEWKCILDVLDGWSAKNRYFDITDYNGNPGAFIIYNYNEK